MDYTTKIILTAILTVFTVLFYFRLSMLLKHRIVSLIEGSLLLRAVKRLTLVDIFCLSIVVVWIWLEVRGFTNTRNLFTNRYGLFDEVIAYLVIGWFVYRMGSFFVKSIRK